MLKHRLATRLPRTFEHGPQQFRRHVVERPRGRAGLQGLVHVLGYAEVRQHELRGGRDQAVHQDVLGLDVPVGDLVLVQVQQS